MTHIGLGCVVVDNTERGFRPFGQMCGFAQKCTCSVHGYSASFSKMSEYQPAGRSIISICVNGIVVLLDYMEEAVGANTSLQTKLLIQPGSLKGCQASLEMNVGV